MARVTPAGGAPATRRTTITEDELLQSFIDLGLLEGTTSQQDRTGKFNMWFKTGGVFLVRKEDKTGEQFINTPLPVFNGKTLREMIGQKTKLETIRSWFDDNVISMTPFMILSAIGTQELDSSGVSTGRYHLSAETLDRMYGDQAGIAPARAAAARGGTPAREESPGAVRRPPSPVGAGRGAPSPSAGVAAAVGSSGRPGFNRGAFKQELADFLRELGNRSGRVNEIAQKKFDALGNRAPEDVGIDGREIGRWLNQRRAAVAIADLDRFVDQVERAVDEGTPAREKSPGAVRRSPSADGGRGASSPRAGGATATGYPPHLEAPRAEEQLKPQDIAADLRGSLLQFGRGRLRDGQTGFAEYELPTVVSDFMKQVTFNRLRSHPLNWVFDRGTQEQRDRAIYNLTALFRNPEDQGALDSLSNLCVERVDQIKTQHRARARAAAAHAVGAREAGTPAAPGPTPPAGGQEQKPTWGRWARSWFGGGGGGR